MANDYKDIIITPQTGSSTDDPSISFRGANTTVNTEITLNVYPDSNGTVSFEGSSGQLFSVTNDMTGTIFAVNDISGIPSIEAYANGDISLNQFGGDIYVGGIKTIAANGAWVGNAYNSFTGGAVVTRHPSGYIFTNYFNCTADVTGTAASHIAVQIGSDNYIRWRTPAALLGDIAALPLAGGTLSGELVANEFGCTAADGRGYRFWNSNSYKIYMSSVAGAGITELSATGDYQTYFRMTGAGRGWVFINASNSTTAAAQITGDGHLHVRQSITAGGNITAYSDIRIKINIETIPDALKKVEGMRGVFFNRKDDETKTRKTGVIAQEVQKVLPEVVFENDGQLSVDYGNIVGILIEAIKELNAKVDKQQEIIDSLQEKL